MKLSEILNNRLTKVKRGKSFIFKDNYYTYFDFEITTSKSSLVSYVVTRRVFLKIDKDKKDFTVLDKDYSDTRIVGGRYKRIKSPFNIYKGKLISKLREKYGEDYLIRIFNPSGEITTDIINYVDQSWFHQNKILLLDNNIYIFVPSHLKNDVFLERVYKLKKLQKKLNN